MLTWNMLEYLLYLLVPVLLLRYFGSRGSRGDGLVRDRRRTLTDYVVYSSLLLTGVLYLYTAVYMPPPNIFKELGVASRAPCYVLRKRLGHLAQQRPWTVPDTGIPTQQQKARGDFARLSYYQSSQYGQWDFLVDRFCRFDSDRILYARMGQSVYLEAGAFGERGMDVLETAGHGVLAGVPDAMHVVRAVALQLAVYLPVLAVAGAATLPVMATRRAPSRPAWRVWAVTLAGVLWAADLYALLSGADGALLLSPDGYAASEFYHDAVTYTRLLLLGLCCLVFLAMDLVMAGRETDVQLLRECNKELAGVLALTKNHTMLETAVMLDTPLRDRLAALWRREEKARQSVFADKEFGEKYRLEVERTRSQRWVDQARGAAGRSLGLEE
ncbi:hypothetical protein EC988_005215 [Linderina pennispora]|nr:hypothetical protein EC988_005215 [Linderina pennispora]